LVIGHIIADFDPNFPFIYRINFDFPVASLQSVALALVVNVDLAYGNLAAL
jgi:hypothetical protein